MSEASARRMHASRASNAGSISTSSTPSKRTRRNASLLLSEDSVMTAMQTHGTMSAAANALGVHRSQLSRAFAKHNAGKRFSEVNSCKRGGVRVTKLHCDRALKQQKQTVQLVLTSPASVSQCKSQANAVCVFMSALGNLTTAGSDIASNVSLGMCHPRFVQLIQQRVFTGAVLMNTEAICKHMFEQWGTETTEEISVWAATREKIADLSIALLQTVSTSQCSSAVAHGSAVGGHEKIVICVMNGMNGMNGMRAIDGEPAASDSLPGVDRVPGAVNAVSAEGEMNVMSAAAACSSVAESVGVQDALGPFEEYVGEGTSGVDWASNHSDPAHAEPPQTPQGDCELVRMQRMIEMHTPYAFQTSSDHAPTYDSSCWTCRTPM